MTKVHVYWVLAAVYGLTAVILGAMGTHAFNLEPGSSRQLLFQTAYFYQLIHALLLIWISSNYQEGFWVRAAAVACSVGVLLFCGGLYLLIFVGKTNYSWITPLGGSLLILAWLNLVIHGFKRLKEKP